MKNKGVRPMLKKVTAFCLAAILALSCVSCGEDYTTVSLVSQGKRVYASSHNDKAGLSRGNVNDGDVTTAWSSNTSTAQIDEWITVDLGKNYTLDSIKLKWGVSRALVYSIEISRGGVEYTTVFENDAADKNITDETLTADDFGAGQVARYVRVRSKKVPSVLMTYMGATIAELEVYGALAKDQTLGTETETMVITKTVEPEESDVVIFGRHYEFNTLSWAGAVYEFQCTGAAAGAVITGRSGNFQVSIDKGEYQNYEIQPGTTEYLFTDKLSEGTHTVRILRDGDPWSPSFTVDGVIIEETGEIVKGYTGDYGLKIEFLGDSITSGAAVDYCDCFTTVAADKLNARFNVVSLSGIGLYKHAGNSTNTDGLISLYRSTIKDGEKDRPYDFDADVVVLNIGANDGGNISRIPDKQERNAYIEECYRRYPQMLDEIVLANPHAAILCTYGQMGMNSDFQKVIIDSVEKFKTEHPEVKIDYFFFEKCFDASEETDWHPAAASYLRDADVLVEKINEILK